MILGCLNLNFLERFDCLAIHEGMLLRQLAVKNARGYAFAPIIPNVLNCAQCPLDVSIPLEGRFILI